MKQVVEAGPTPFHAFYAPLLRRRGWKRRTGGDKRRIRVIGSVPLPGGEGGTDSQGGHVARTPVQRLENVRSTVFARGFVSCNFFNLRRLAQPSRWMNIGIDDGYITAELSKFGVGKIENTGIGRLSRCAISIIRLGLNFGRGEGLVGSILHLRSEGASVYFSFQRGYSLENSAGLFRS